MWSPKQGDVAARASSLPPSRWYVPQTESCDICRRNPHSMRGRWPDTRRASDQSLRLCALAVSGWTAMDLGVVRRNPRVRHADTSEVFARPECSISSTDRSRTMGGRPNAAGFPCVPSETTEPSRRRAARTLLKRLAHTHDSVSCTRVRGDAADEDADLESTDTRQRRAAARVPTAAGLDAHHAVDG